MKNKNIIEELICHELSRLDELLEVLKELNIVKIPPKGYLSESDAWCWYEDNPSEEKKKRVLTALGYDVSKL